MGLLHRSVSTQLAAAASCRCVCVCVSAAARSQLCSWGGGGREPPQGERSLQHDVFEVLLQYGVLDGVEDKADVLRVDGGGEVVEQRLAPVPPLTAERLHQERLRGGKKKRSGLSVSFESHFLNIAYARRDGEVGIGGGGVDGSAIWAGGLDKTREKVDPIRITRPLIIYFFSLHTLKKGLWRKKE